MSPQMTQYEPSYGLSVGIWCLGRQRPTRFSAESTAQGWARVPDRLRALKEASDRWSGDYGWGPVNASFHTVHEIRSAEMRGANSDNVVEVDEFIEGVERGEFPRCTAITAPAFGFEGSEFGVIRNPDPRIRAQGKANHLEAIAMTRRFKQLGVGEGLDIWWPGEDGGFNPLEVPADARWSNLSIPESPEWALRRDFWIDTLRAAAELAEVKATAGDMPDMPIVCFEPKGGDPGIDVISTGHLARKFRAEVNAGVGFYAMGSNVEVAHSYGVGEPFDEDLAANIADGQFCGYWHANSGQLLRTRHHQLLEKGVHPLDLSVIYDWDFPFGYGSPAVVTDQRNAVARMKRWSAETGRKIHVEFDLVGGTLGPVGCLETSIQNFVEFWEEADVTQEPADNPELVAAGAEIDGSPYAGA